MVMLVVVVVLVFLNRLRVGGSSVVDGSCGCGHG